MTQLVAGTPLLGGRFTIAGPLGQGDIVSLYAIRGVTDGRPYLLELLTGPSALDEGAWEDCVRGAERAGTAPDPFAALVESGTDHGFGRCLVREPMPGPSLAMAMGTAPLALRDIAALLENLAPALDRAHAAGLVHGGIAPQCVFPAAPGAKPKIAEYGVASMRARRPSPWPIPLGWGAPEQARGDSPIPQSDQYAIALVCHLALTGRPFFKALQVAAPVDLQALWNEMLAPAAPATGLGTAVDQALATALHPNPQDRFPNVTALFGALKAAAAGIGPAVAPIPATGRLPPAAAQGQKRALGGTVLLSAGPPPEMAKLDGNWSNSSAPPAEAPPIGPTLASASSETANSPPTVAVPQVLLGAMGPMPAMPGPEPLAPGVQIPPAAGTPPPMMPAGALAQAPLVLETFVATAQAPGMQGPAGGMSPAPVAQGPSFAVPAPLPTDGQAAPRRSSPLKWILAAVAVVFVVGMVGVVLAVGLYLRAGQQAAAARASAEAQARAAEAQARAAEAEATTQTATGMAMDAAAAVAPSASAGEATTDARITFECTPECDAVECDGKAIEPVNAGVALSPGEHRCKLGRQGYLTREETIQAAAGTTETKRFELAPDPKAAASATTGTATATPPGTGTARPTGGHRPGKCGTFINPCPR
ncbi:MAG: hypothetical protein JW751_11820 [Polyangiaceae bacterium]|nr:hypothetical protein [Polyangiaceae bacterium]